MYAGAGGLSLGFEQAGFSLLAAVEQDPVHALVHRFNFPQCEVLCCDASAVTVSTLQAIAEGASCPCGCAEPTVLDALIGGPPCQGFSAGGVRDSRDERNGQLLAFVDLIVEAQPRVFCLENVAGLLEARFEPLRKEAIRRLTVDGGYDVTGFTAPVNAVSFGVPQRRRRVLLMGSRVGTAPVLDFPDGALTTVEEAFEGLPDISRYRRLLRSDEAVLTDDDLVRARSARSAYARRLIGLDRDPLDASAPRIFDETLVTNSLRTVHSAKTVQRFARTQPGRVEPVSRLFRLDPDGQARTLRAGTGSDRGSHTSPRPIHPIKNRVITVREAARLHGYPDWFRFHTTNWHGHRQVGNSVPPPLAAAAGRALLLALGLQPPSQAPGAMPLGPREWLSSTRREAEELLRGSSVARH